MPQNGGASCPSCRGLSTSVMPSRILQSMVNVLLRADPSRVRTPSERAQADEIYRPGQSLRVRNRFPSWLSMAQLMDVQIPPPREASPEPTLPRNTDYAQPCPHCIPGNPFGWKFVNHTAFRGVPDRRSFQLPEPNPRSGHKPRPRVAFGGRCPSRSRLLWALVSPLRFSTLFT